MKPSPLDNPVIWQLGPVPVTRPVVTTWAIMGVLALVAWLITRRLRPDPARPQMLLELVVSVIQEQIEAVTQRPARNLLPLVATLFVFITTANLSGLLPGVESPTGALETTAALAVIVFFSVHYFGIRARGWRGHLASFAQPKWMMLPLNLLAEVTRTLALSVRLFGNVMSGEFVIAMVAALAGLLVPIPFMALELLVGVIQAYIFTVLATVFIGAAVSGIESGDAAAVDKTPSR